MEEQEKILNDVTQSEYKYGFITDIDTDILEKGLNEDVIRLISAKKEEPEFMLEFRLEAYKKWLKMKMPNWAYLKVPPIDFQEISYYAAPKKKAQYSSLMKLIRSCWKHLISLEFRWKSKNSLPELRLMQLSIVCR